MFPLLHIPTPDLLTSAKCAKINLPQLKLRNPRNQLRIRCDIKQQPYKPIHTRTHIIVHSMIWTLSHHLCRSSPTLSFLLPRWVDPNLNTAQLLLLLVAAKCLRGVSCCSYPVVQRQKQSAKNNLPFYVACCINTYTRKWAGAL